MSGTEAQDIEHRCKMCGRLREHLEEGRGDEVHYSNISLPDTEAAAKSGCVFCLFLVSAVTRVHRHSNIPIVGDTFSYSYRGTSGMTLRIGHSKKYPGYDDLDLVDFNVYTTCQFALSAGVILYKC
jgi:hypothetical protein